MSRSELLRRRRCRALQLAAVLGLFLPVSQPSWITVGVAAVALTVIAVVYWRDCRGRPDTASARDDTPV
jgi:hypothetical protein